MQSVSEQKVQHLRMDIRHPHQLLFSFAAPLEDEDHVLSRYVRHRDDAKPHFESLVRALMILRIPNSRQPTVGMKTA